MGGGCKGTMLKQYRQMCSSWSFSAQVDRLGRLTLLQGMNIFWWFLFWWSLWSMNYMLKKDWLILSMFNDSKVVEKIAKFEWNFPKNDTFQDHFSTSSDCQKHSILIQHVVYGSKTPPEKESSKNVHPFGQDMSPMGANLSAQTANLATVDGNRSILWGLYVCLEI